MGIMDRIRGAFQRKRKADVRKRAASSNTWSQSGFGVGMNAASGSAAYYAMDPKRQIIDGFRVFSGTVAQMMDQDLFGLVQMLRQLERNEPIIKACVEAHKDRAVGTGITVAPDTGDKVLDKRIKEEFEFQMESLGSAGQTDMEIQRLFMAELDLAGTALGRWVMIEDKTLEGYLPQALMPIEVEWLSREPVKPVHEGMVYSCGIEWDVYGRSQWFHLRNPDKGMDDPGEVVPASEMLIAYEHRRARQPCGEPGLAIAIERSVQRGRLIDSELKTAVNASTLATKLTSDLEIDEEEDGEDASGNATYVSSFELGAHYNLKKGDDLEIMQSDRPNTDVNVFAEHLNADTAAGAQVSRVDLNKDGSQYNFANSKFDQIRQNMHTRPVQKWFGKRTIGAIYKRFLPLIMVSLGEPLPRSGRARAALMKFKLIPDIPPEADEKSQATAFEKLKANNGTTLQEWYGSKGKDWEVELEQRAKEKDRERELGLLTEETAEESAEPIEEEEVENAATTTAN